MFLERVGAFIHCVAGDRGDRAALLGQHCRDLDIVHRDLAKHRLLRGVRLGTERGAFQKLAGEIGQRRRKAAADRRRREDRAIAAAPADDHVGVGIEQFNIGVDARDRDDMAGSIERRKVERRPPVEPFDSLAGEHAAPQFRRRDLRIEIAQAKLRQAMLRGDVADHRDEQIDAAVAAGVARRADDHRHAEPARSEQHRFQILVLPLPRARRDVGSERPGADVAGAGIGADHIRLGGAADREAAGLDRREAEMPIRAQKAQVRLGRAAFAISLGLDRDRQGQIPSDSARLRGIGHIT